jgi:thiazole/oxazole-forming peptide maturase SagD family component
MSFNEMRRKNLVCIDPVEYDTFSDTQRSKRPSLGSVTHDSIFAWVKAKRITNEGKIECYAPAQLLYWNYKTKLSSAEPSIRPRGTHGGAGYFTKEGALLRALYEWAARDGFFSHWLENKAPQRIHIGFLDLYKMRRDVLMLYKKSLEKNYTVSLYNVSNSANVFSIFCVLESELDGSFARFVSGSGASCNFEDAVLSAMEEAHSIRHWLFSNKVNLSGKALALKDKNYDDVARLSWWSTQKTSDYSFFSTGDVVNYRGYLKSLQLSDEKDTLKNLIEVWIRDGKEILYHESDWSLLKDVGYFSVKVLVRDLYPMYHESQNWPAKYMERRGLTTETVPNPHPFP